MFIRPLPPPQNTRLPPNSATASNACARFCCPESDAPQLDSGLCGLKLISSSVLTLPTVTFFLSGPSSHKICHQIKFRAPLSLCHKKGYWGALQVFLGWMSPIYRFCRLATFKVDQPVPSCRFDVMTQNWSIDFLDFNKTRLAEYVVLLINATSFRVRLLCFLKEYRACYAFYARESSSFVSACIPSPLWLQT